MSKTWTVIMYSAIGVVSAATIFVAGHVTGTKRAGKSKKLPVQESATTQEVAQA
jgi:hypothetical protein